MLKTLAKFLVCLALALVLVACAEATPAPTATPLPTATASAAPTETLALTVTLTLTQKPTATATLIPTPTPHPALAFAGPILAAVANIPPQFTEDFSKGQHGWSWDDRQGDQVQIVDGVMKVEGTGGHGIFPPHNLLNSKNFIFEFDVRLLNADTSIGTFFHQQSSTIWYGFTIQGDRSWHLHVTQTDIDVNGRRNIRLLGEINHIVIIAREEEFAVYLNGQPTAYLKDDTFMQAGSLMPTFKGENGGSARGEFDNFKFWDLDKVRLAPAAGAVVPAVAAEPGILFDDFNYATRAEMSGNSWIIREKPGWPGVPGATFSQENVTFWDDPATNGNRLMRMTSSTDGTSAKTSQTQVCHQRKYLYGTYAARVRFSDAPVSGPDGDQVVETFYAITPYIKPFAPDYSEMDFEYLPNGGWGSAPQTLHVTAWETVQIEPWQADNASDASAGSLEGWHTLVLQAENGAVRYYLDGAKIAEHSGNYYPDAPMSLNFNLWFIDGGLLKNGSPRTYEEDVDWVFYQADVNLTPAEVLEKIDTLRKGSVKFQDTVPPANPPLDSPCDL